MKAPKFSYKNCVDLSEKVSWRLDQILPEDTILNFEKPHMPEALTETDQLTCLNQSEQLKLNHVRSNSYMNLFAFLEEYIIVLTVQHAQAEMHGDHDAIRALLRFSEEELKHQALFKRYCRFFDRDFGTSTKVLDQPAAIADVILSKSPIAVLLITLHFEVVTQQHYIECIKDDDALDPLPSSILKHHWLEEAQHIKIDHLELCKLAQGMPPEAISKAFDDYFEILSALDGLLEQQTDMDIESLQIAAGRQFTNEEFKEIKNCQYHSYRNGFFVMGMENKIFLRITKDLSPIDYERVLEQTEIFNKQKNTELVGD